MNRRSPDTSRGAALGLGPLEEQVMTKLWEGGRPRRVRDVQEALRGSWAYTTLMTTLDRLYKKGFLARRKEGRAFLYTARVSRDALLRRFVRRALDTMLGGDSNAARPVLSSLVEAVGDRDRELLDDLERLVAEERRRAPEDKPR